AARKRPAAAASEARALLERALDLAPDAVVALEALADLEISEGHLEPAERLLERALAVHDPRDAEQAAHLHYRLAACLDGLGKLDEAYRALLDADRESPGQLLIRLGLGENRFRARRWREAALHLEAVGEHKDAEKYPDQVAQGLVYAAEAELRLRRR